MQYESAGAAEALQRLVSSSIAAYHDLDEKNRRLEGVGSPQMTVTAEYAHSLPQIYRDLLAAFPQFNPTRKAGYGLSYQSLYSALNGKYTLGQIKLACEQMAQAGFMVIKHAIFATPTPSGEELIAAVIGGEPALDTGVPPFPIPHN